MAKTFIYFISLLFLYSCNTVNFSGTTVNPVVSESVVEPKKSKHVIVKSKHNVGIVDIAESQVGVRELTGNNDGPEVEMYLKNSGLGPGYAWCSSFIKWVLDSAAVKNSITAYSPSAYQSRKVVWKREWVKEFKPGQVFTLYYSSLGRIAHTGFCVDREDNVIITIEGNTSLAGSREGDGVYKKKRSLNTLYAICEFRQ
jgi:hypothetical protein